MSRVSLEYHARRNARITWGRKTEEFAADFYLVTKRALSEEDFTLFRYHFLLGADWRLCCRKMNIDRGSFFHQVYRIEQILGRTYRELEPYALYPLDEYFNGSTYVPRAATPAPVQSEHTRLSSRIPLRKVA